MPPAQRSTHPTVVVVTTMLAVLAVLLPPLADEAAAGVPVVPTVHDHGGHVHDAAAALAAAAAQIVPSDVCDGFAVLDVADGPSLCTHGPDTAPAAMANGSGAPVPRQPIGCFGNGSDGQRVEVLYVHGPGSSGASSAMRSSIGKWVEQVEWTVRESARRLGGDRQVRWRTTGCSLRVVSQQVSSTALGKGQFSRMVDELRSAGWSRSDRSYLLFVDSTAYCGIATAPRDDRPTSNRADRTSGYARVDRGCWGAGDQGYHSIAAHELLHTLGAVQASAPNGTTGAHCTDEHDLLCYDEGDGVRVVCRDSDNRTSGAGDANDRLLDCRGDDYFHPSPRSGSYLATHWNTADSARLHDPNARPASGGGSGGGTSPPPSPTRDPVGYVLHLVLG